MTPVQVARLRALCDNATAITPAERLCPACSSERRVSVSFTGGMTTVWQCVPCGATYPKAASQMCVPVRDVLAVLDRAGEQQPEQPETLAAAIDAAARTMYDSGPDGLHAEDWQGAVATATRMVTAALPHLAASQSAPVDPASCHAGHVAGQADALARLVNAARHPHKGPEDTDASMLLKAAARIRAGYVAGGSHTSETVALALTVVAEMVAASADPAQDGPGPERHEEHCGGKPCANLTCRCWCHAPRAESAASGSGPVPEGAGTPEGGTGDLSAAANLGDWREDGTGRVMSDGTPATCDSSFNRGYDEGYGAGLQAGAPPVRSPRWDQDPVVLRHGWLAGRCGNCGEEVPPAEADRGRG